MECTQLSLFGRTYPEPSPVTTERTSEQSWKNLPAWSNQTLLFLDLRGGQMEQSRSNRRKRMVFGVETAGQSIFRSGPAPKAYRSYPRPCQRAGEILFERTSLSRHPDPCIPAWKEVAGLTTNCSAGNDRVVAEGGAERSLHLENTFGMRRRRQGCAGADGENRDTIDTPRPTDSRTDILH